MARNPSYASAVDLLDQLVAFDSTSAKSNLDLIAFVSAFLEDQGVAAQTVPSDDGTKANLLARIGPEVPGGVVLSGHTDVVPVTGQTWSSDPFVLTERDGRLHARGAADMKGFIAVVLATVPLFQARPLAIPIHLAFSYDEEVGCLGSPRLLDRLAAAAPKPALAIVGEPSGMKVGNSHRGIAAFQTRVTGRPAHSSDPDAGVNAIAEAAECIAFLSRLGADFAKDRERAEGMAPDWTTINVGLIEGGAAVNIIAQHCRFGWECRPEAGTDVNEVVARLRAFAERQVLPRMRAVSPDAAIATEETVSVPGLAVDPGSPAETLALALSGHNGCVSVPFTSEAGLFQGAGIPAVICGPGSAAQAHQPDEFVTVDQLDACAAFMRRLADWAMAR
jgi:acetylornithine deacetylase